MSRPRLIGLLLALLTLLLYLRVGSYGFLVYDDDDYVTNNAVVQSGITWAGVKWAFTATHASNWHPLTWLSHMLDCQLFGLNPGPQHLVNVLFHTANSVLLFVLLLRLTQALWPSAIVAALFAWHPLHVESVAWISERKDVLSTFFGILALLAYTRYAQKQSSIERRDSNAAFLNFQPSTFNYCLALLWFALGLMSKPMLVTWPFVMLLLDFWPLRRLHASTVQRLLVEKIPFFLLTAISCVITYVAQHSGEAVVSLAKVSLPCRLENAPVAVSRYLLKMIWPTDLAVIYPMHAQFPAVVVGAAVAIILIFTALAWRTRNTAPWWLAGWLWFLGTLVPVIGLVQVGGASMADRYSYIPSIGLFIAVAFGIFAWAGHIHLRQSIITMAAALALISTALVTERQLGFWRNSETLFRHALAVTHDNEIAHLNLGVAREQQGDDSGALAQYRLAAKLAPGRYQVHYNLGNLLDRIGERDQALAEYREAVRLNPKLASLHNALGVQLAELGRFNEATNELTAAAALDPAYPWPRLEMGKVLLEQGRDAQAIEQFREALRIDPNNYQILTYSAHVLAAEENLSIRNGQMAVALATKANDLSGRSQPVVLDILGMAFAASGDFRNAQACAQTALDLATAAKMKNLDQIRHRLQLYENHQAWTESFRATNSTGKKEAQD